MPHTPLPDEAPAPAELPPKEPAARLELRARPQPVTRLSRLVIGGVAAVLIVLLFLALGSGLRGPGPPQQAREDAAGPHQVGMPEGWQGLPATYGDLAKAADKPVSVAPASGVTQASVAAPPSGTAPASAVASTSAVAPAPRRVVQAPGPAPAQEPSPEEQARAEARRKAAEEADKARKSGLFFPTPPGPASAEPGSPVPGAITPGLGMPGLERLLQPSNPEAPKERPPVVPDQSEKRGFLQVPGAEATALKSVLQAPVSPYEVKAGTLIPAVLLTGLNSDLPGPILAQVREPVYDTVRGQFLLIPQGSRLLGTYDAAVIYGQDRLLVVWTRLVLPNGESITLAGMPGVDLAGAAGFGDRVDHHYWRLLGGVVLSSLLNLGTRLPAGDVAAGHFFPSLGQEVAADIGQGIQKAGQQVVKKQLEIPPTITIRPGFTINVFVHRDMVLRPYQAVVPTARQESRR